MRNAQGVITASIRHMDCLEGHHRVYGIWRLPGRASLSRIDIETVWMSAGPLGANRLIFDMLAQARVQAKAQRHFTRTHTYAHRARLRRSP